MEHKEIESLLMSRKPNKIKNSVCPISNMYIQGTYKNNLCDQSSRHNLVIDL